MLLVELSFLILSFYPFNYVLLGNKALYNLSVRFGPGQKNPFGFFWPNYVCFSH